MCTVCRGSLPAGRALYCSDRCMHQRGTRAQQLRRWRKKSRVTKCERCAALWTYLKAGGLPRMCPSCAKTHRFCSSCQAVKEISLFHRDGQGGRNRTCSPCHSAALRADPRTSERAKAAKLRKYGLTVKEYEAIATAQGGQCALCKKKPRYGLCVDHCHASGKVRALLCKGCNTGLGAFGDDPARLREAIDYLLKPAVR